MSVISITFESFARTYLFDLVLQELNEAKEKFPSFASHHEGYAVLLEEVDELWDEIKGNQDPDRLVEEAIQVAAMALRFIEDTIKAAEDDDLVEEVRT